jgi:hypothetical protein
MTFRTALAAALMLAVPLPAAAQSVGILLDALRRHRAVVFQRAAMPRPTCATTAPA